MSGFVPISFPILDTNGKIPPGYLPDASSATGYQAKAEKGAASGYCPLDSGGAVPGANLAAANLPAIVATGATVERSLQDRFANVHYANDFSTFAAAVAAANASGKTLVISTPQMVSTNVGGITAPLRFEGTGRISTVSGGTVIPACAITAPLRNQQIFDSSGGGTLNTSGLRVPFTVPQWWGATGDNVHDDTQAIQSALDSGREIYLCAGSYKVTNSLDLKGGDASYRLIRGQGRLTQIYGHTTGLPVLDGSGASDLIIEGITVIGDPVDTPSVGILFYRSTSGVSSGNHTVRNVLVTGQFTVAALYAVASESNKYVDSGFSNDRANATMVCILASNLYGVTSVFRSLPMSPAGGNTAHHLSNLDIYSNQLAAGSDALVLDGIRSIQMTSVVFAGLGNANSGIRVRGNVTDWTLTGESETVSAYFVLIDPGVTVNYWNVDHVSAGNGIYGSAGSQVLNSTILGEFAFAQPPGGLTTPGASIDLDTVKFSTLGLSQGAIVIRTTAHDNIIRAGSQGVSAGNFITWPVDSQGNLYSYYEGGRIVWKTDGGMVVRDVVATAGAGLNGVNGTGGSGDGSGLVGVGGATNGLGVLGTGAGTGAGVRGVGGATNGRGAEGQGTGSGDGVKGTGGATNGAGVRGVGTGTGTGVIGTAGVGGPAQGGNFTGNNVAEGAFCTGGNSSGTGIVGVGGAPNGPGAIGIGTGTGTAVEARGSGSSGYGVQASGNATRAPLHLVPLAAAPSTPAEGNVYPNSVDHLPYYRDNAAWRPLDTTASFTDDSATPGDRTVNKYHGINAFGAGGTSITITNSLVAATSRVFPVLQTNDATAILKNAVPVAGSFTINLSAAATGITKVGWEVVN